MRLGLLEMNISWEDKEANFRTLEYALGRAREQELELLLLPEMSFTGFSMNTEQTGEEEPETLRRCQELSKAYGVALGVGWVRKPKASEGNSLCENHYSLVDGERVACDYVKLHPFSYAGENRYFLGGSCLATTQLKGIRAGLQICYDLRFPEPFRILADLVDLVILPANWPGARALHWDTLTRARAIENQMYLAAVNCRGEMDGKFYDGGSRLLAPDGTDVEPVCREIIQERHLLLVYDTGLDVRPWRDSFPVLEDRRRGLYHKLEREANRN